MSERNEYIESIIAKMHTINYVQPGEVPNIELYMDQVTKFMDEHLESSKRFSDDLLPSPEKKKYTKDHMYMLLFIYYLKNILSISDTKAILKPLTENFFTKDGQIDFETIYNGIFKIEKDQAGIITRDVIRKLEKSAVSFEDVENPEQKELLQRFSFIAMLCFDVYMKKQMIGLLVDEYFSDPSQHREKEAEESK